VKGEAVGGTGINNVTGARLAAALAVNARKVVIFFGANDLSNIALYPTETDWFNAELALAATLRAGGSKVYLGTVLFQCNATEHNRRAKVVNALIRAEVGKRIDGVADYASDAILSVDGAMCSPDNSTDGVHLWDQTVPGKVDGQSRLEVFDEAALN
jgi:hypothetical protein